MHIPPTSAAAQAASILAQSAAKDASSEAAASGIKAAQAHAAEANVEQSTQANAERDAQGQQDGLSGGRSPPRQPDELELEGETRHASASDSPQLPGEPPSQLDIVT